MWQNWFSNFLRIAFCLPWAGEVSIQTHLELHLNYCMSEKLREWKGKHFLSFCVFFSICFSFSFFLPLFLSLSHIKNYTLYGRWNRWVSCWSHIYENVLKWLGLNVYRPRGGQFQTYAFCIWLCWMTVLFCLLYFFYFFFRRCCTVVGLLLKLLRMFFEKTH